MNKDSKMLLVLISAVLITSGCVDNNDSDSNTSPISVNDFSITPNPAPGDQTVRVQMELQNNGDNDAEDVYARLFGPTFSSEVEEGQSRTWRNPDDDTNRVSTAYRTMNFNNLNAGTDTSPAIPRTGTVSFTTPNLDSSRIVDYTFNSRIQYEYRTTGNTEVRVMSNERYQDTGASQTRPAVENSDGPIQIDVQGTTPHVFYDTGTADDEICVTLTNSGSGDPFLTTTDDGVSPSDDGSGYDVTDEAEDRLELRIEDVGNVEFESQESDGNNVVVDIIGDQGYHCFDMTLVGLGEITDLEQTTDIPIEAVYGYEEESSTTVTVEGRN